VKKREYAENELKPKAYKLNEAKKKEILPHIQQANKTSLPKKRRGFPIKPAFGLGVSALLLFILFANPILISLRQETGAGVNEESPQINLNTEQSLVKLLGKENVEVQLLNEEYDPHINAQKVTGVVSFSIPKSSQVNGNKSSFRVRIWNDHISEMSKVYYSEPVFSKDTRSGLFSFEIPLTREEVEGLKKQNVTLGLYIYPEWEGESSTKAHT